MAEALHMQYHGYNMSIRDPLSIQSEIAPLEAVVVHTPGLEIERMTPSRAEELLYNDIVPMSVVQREHQVLSGVLGSLCECHELSDLLVRALENGHLRANLLEAVCTDEPAASRRAELDELTPTQLAGLLITGLPIRRDSLASFLEPRGWDIPPLPNQYFMRDAGFVVGTRAFAGSMAHPVRRRESLIMQTIFAWLDGAGDQPLDSQPFSSRIEGGDIIVLRDDLIAAGIGQRTAADPLDQLAQSLAAHRNAPCTIIACLLPDERSAIHLDMIFTRIDEEHALVHAPAVLGHTASRCVRLDVEPDGRTKVREAGLLLDALSEAGVDLKPVFCGGQDGTHQAREQWLSGTNSFAVAPGRIIVYDCNRYTLDELARNGYEVIPADVYDHLRAGSQKVAIALPGVELARGGGGPRCMTMPLRRA